MSTTDGSVPRSGLQAALADIAERRRRDPMWSPGLDPTYSGPLPSRLETMTEAEYAAYQEQREKEREWLCARPPVGAPAPRLQLMTTGQRIRRLRLALGWTQGEAAARLGVSRRTVIRHEQGWPGRAPGLWRLNGLERAYARELAASQLVKRAESNNPDKASHSPASGRHLGSIAPRLK